MKFILFVFISFLALNTFAFDHSYTVSGEDENGKLVEGTIYSTNGERNVSGEITDENGNTQDFEGQWNSTGQISGETNDGISIDLSTN
jgi:hypothetical protein